MSDKKKECSDLSSIYLILSDFFYKIDDIEYKLDIIINELECSEDDF